MDFFNVLIKLFFVSLHQILCPLAYDSSATMLYINKLQLRSVSFQEKHRKNMKRHHLNKNLKDKVYRQ